MKSSLGLMAMLVISSSMLACGAGSGTCAIDAGTLIDVAHTGGTGNCSQPIVSGVLALNGSESFTTAKNVSCQGGPATFTQDIKFITQDSVHQTCSGTDAISFTDLAADGGTGTDTLAVTCPDGTSCSEMFGVTFAPQ